MLTKAKDRREVGKLGITNPLRNGKASNGDTSHKIRLEEV